MDDEETYAPKRAPAPEPPPYVPVAPDAADLAMQVQHAELRDDT